MADINGIVTIGAAETPGAATVLLFNETGDTLVASTTSNASTGAYAFTGLAGGTVYRVVVLGNNTYRTRAYGPCTAIVAADEYKVNYVSLLHFDGADASTTFTDQGGKVWTPNGNAQIDTAQSKFGGASGLFDGVTGSIVSTPSHADFNFASGDLTIEGWVRPAVDENEAGFICRRSGGAQGWCLGMYADGSLTIRAQIGGDWSDSYCRSAAGVVPLGSWTHVAMVRYGNVWTLYANGVSVGTMTKAGALHDQAEPIRLGAANDSSEWLCKGHLDDWRITKKALYTANFTTPTQAFPDGRTVSLLHFDGADGSTTFTDQCGKVWTASGEAQIDTAQAKFGASSLLLDGASDYIYGDGSADLAFGAGDFTVELWIRPAALTAPHVLFDFRPSGTNNGDYPYCYIDTANIVYNTSATDQITAAHGISAGAWVHVAICRGAGVTRAFVGGVQKGGNFTSSQSMVVGASRPTVGSSGGNTPGQYGFNGHFDDLRITKGAARYTANFTPPSDPFPNP